MGPVGGLRRREVLLLGALLACWAAGHARAEWLPGTVQLSDGTSVEGKVYVPNDRILIQNEAQARRYSVRTAEIAKLETSIEKQSLEEKWIFRESGRDDKIYLGQYYPVRYYSTTVTFHDGRTLAGHIIAATVYVKSDGKQYRYSLRRKQEGKVGQKLQDLQYVKSVTFSTDAGGVRGTIEGTLKLPPGEGLRKVLAINREKLFSIEGKFSPATGKYEVADCTAGVYDLVVVTSGAVYLHFSRERDKKAQRLDSTVVAGMQQWVNKLRDFYHTQTITYAAGDPERTFALVWKERRGGTTLQGAERVHRYDIWAMHKPKDEWLIEKRFYVWRAVSQNVDLKQLSTIVTPALGGHTVSAQMPDLRVDATLGPNKELPIPPPDPPKEKKDGERDTAA